MAAVSVKRSIGFGLLRITIAFKNSRQLFHPIRSQTKINCQHVFPRASRQLQAFSYFLFLSFDWFIGLFVSFVIG